MKGNGSSKILKIRLACIIGIVLSTILMWQRPLTALVISLIFITILTVRISEKNSEFLVILLGKALLIVGILSVITLNGISDPLEGRWEFIPKSSAWVISQYANAPELQAGSLVLLETPLGTKVSYPTQKEKVDKQNVEMKDKATQILKDLPDDLSDVEKLIWIEDYLTKNTRLVSGASGFTAYDVVVSNQGACQGISLAYKYLAERAGIKGVKCITGTLPNGEAHMRNVYIAGQFYYETDITVNITQSLPVMSLSNKGDYPNEFQMELDNAALLTVGNTFPGESAKLSYWDRNNLVVTSVKELDSLLANKTKYLKVTENITKEKIKDIARKYKVKRYRIYSDIVDFEY